MAKRGDGIPLSGWKIEKKMLLIMAGRRSCACQREKSGARAWWSCRRWTDATARRGEVEDLVQFRLDRLDELRVRRRNFPFREGIHFWFMYRKATELLIS